MKMEDEKPSIKDQINGLLEKVGLKTTEIEKVEEKEDEKVEKPEEKQEEKIEEKTKDEIVDDAHTQADEEEDVKKENKTLNETLENLQKMIEKQNEIIENQHADFEEIQNKIPGSITIQKNKNDEIDNTISQAERRYQYYQKLKNKE